MGKYFYLVCTIDRRKPIIVYNKPNDFELVCRFMK